MAKKSKLYVGMDVHKDTVMVAVLPAEAAEPTVVKRLPNEASKIRRWLGRISREGEVRACYEASGVGYVLERAMRHWGYECEIVAPSLIPRRPGDRRKHDRNGVSNLGSSPQVKSRRTRASRSSVGASIVIQRSAARRNAAS